MLETPLPRLRATKREIDQAPEVFGELVSSNHLLGDPEALRDEMDIEGYLFLPGLLNREEVLAARRVMAEQLAAKGLLDPDAPLMDVIAHPQADISFMAELAQDNPPLRRVLYDGPMMAFFERFLGGEVRHYDYTWVRAVAPERGTAPHMDIVFMGRGTTRLYTAWTPIGDVPLATGGLLILERSHKHDRLNKGYGRKDADAFCTNRRGDKYTNLGGGGNISPGGWLSKDAVKLRERLGGRWLTANFLAGDVLIFSMFTSSRPSPSTSAGSARIQSRTGLRPSVR
jgi:hypothetical protein